MGTPYPLLNNQVMGGLKNNANNINNIIQRG